MRFCDDVTVDVIHREVTVFFDVCVCISRSNAWTNNESNQRWIAANVCDAREHSHIAFSGIGDGRNQIRRFIARAAIDEIQSLDFVHLLNLRSINAH